MNRKKNWIRLSIINLCLVAFIGFILRSKIVFTIPAINYNNLLESHYHFAFNGWVTLVLLILLIYDLLPSSLHDRPVYQWILRLTFFISLATFFSYYIEGNHLLTKLLSVILILITYVFGWFFISDLRKENTSKPVSWLAIASILSLIISSVGPLALDYSFAVKSLNVIVYRDELYTYLHFQYNGFFPLAIFSLLFHRIETTISNEDRKKLETFAKWFIISIIPSLFLSFLWQDPNNIFRVIAIAGSILIILSLIALIFLTPALLKAFHMGHSMVKYLMGLSISAFFIKTFLQGFTIFPAIGNEVFGNRPIIIGFLHLVFLGFVTLFILGYLGNIQILDVKKRLTRLALIVFSIGVILNELFLLVQGLGAMFFKSSDWIPWMLWITSMILFIGAVFILMAQIKSGLAGQKFISPET